MFWILIFCIQAAFAVDQNLLDSFKTVKEKFQQAQDALGQFEKLLQQETGVIPNSEINVDIYEESPNLEKEYRILDSMNAWNRMSTWTRPKISSDQSTKPVSEAVEEVDRKQPNSYRNISIGKTTVKIFKDTKNNTMILSLKTRTDAEFPLFQMFVKVYSAYIKLLPGMCGKGLCFVAEKKGADCLLIFTADMTPHQYFQLSILLSHSDMLSVRIDSIASLDNDTLLTYHFQEFQVHYEDDNQVIIDPQDSHINLRTTINLSSTKDANSSNNTDIQPNKFFEPGTHDKSMYGYSGSDNYTLGDGKYQAIARYDLNPDKPMDGIINFGQEIRIDDYISLEIHKQYTVFPKGQEDSTYFLNSAIVGQAHKQGNLQANLPHAFFIGIYGAPTDISIRKNLKTRLSYDFPGFEFLITRYFKGQVSVVLTSYNVTVEDSGTYEIIASFEGGRFMKYSFEVNVVNKMIRIDRFWKSDFIVTKNDGKDKISVEVTCTVTGDPLPTVYFTSPMTHDNSSTSALQEIKLENNETFEIKPPEVTGDSITRKLFVHKLPESSSYPYEIKCKATTDEQEEFEIVYVYDSDFEIY
ncbi:hypothetical protein LOTGIDRAFT_174446 [Lottia gigantea]|uniref:Uncharacterized protein n=1 Tax=Lottia gigantea TaxID=225164 RepID=V4ALP4_LOTGI|nr:hypothetical protein LOTGIDRAFT_174446 [Lottia gigantea]ESO98042.1 hypothetical protein LOTGIDRAFT_174446 [Lottia gigantea]